MDTSYTGFERGGYDEDIGNDSITFQHTKKNIVKGSIVSSNKRNTVLDEPKDNQESQTTEMSNLIEHHVKGFVGLTVNTLKEEAEQAVDQMMTRIVKDDPLMNKYGHLAKTGYDNYKNENPIKALNESGYDFKAVDELNTNADNFIVESVDEVHMNFRGTMNMDDWLDKNTRIMSEKLFGEMEKTDRFIEAEAQVIKAMKYADSMGKELTLSGHSLGGWFSYYFAKKFNLKGYHYNPAISQSQADILLKETAAEGIVKQNVFRTATDTPSATIVMNHHTFDESKTVDVKTVSTKPGLDENLIDVHDIEQFTTNTKGVRNTHGGSIIKSLKGVGKKVVSKGGTALAMGAALFQEVGDVKKDLKNNDNTIDKVDDSIIDTVKNVAVLGASSAVAVGLGAELFIPALLTGFYISLAGETAAHNLKKNTKETVKVLKNSIETGKDVNGDNISSKIGSSFKRKNDEWEHRFSSAGNSIKHFFHW